MKTFSFALIIYGLIILSYTNKRKNKDISKVKNIRNNLSSELESINDKILNSGNLDIDNLLNEHGFLKANYDSLSENEKLNYSLIHGYI